MKKVGLYLFVIIAMFGCRQSTNAQYNIDGEYDFPYKNEVKTTTKDKTDIARIIKTDNIDNKDSLLGKVRGIFEVDGVDYKDKPGTAYIKMLVNMALGFVSLISLILVIFAFYLILFDKGEEGVKKAKTIIKGVTIAIVLIGVSWLIVSFFFDFYVKEVMKP